VKTYGFTHKPDTEKFVPPVVESTMQWKIERQGRRWSKEEIQSRYHAVCPDGVELIEGKLFWTEADRLNVLAMLLENVGIDKALTLADPALWQEALDALNSK
jgi:hypothetical protein